MVDERRRFLIATDRLGVGAFSTARSLAVSKFTSIPISENDDCVDAGGCAKHQRNIDGGKEEAPRLWKTGVFGVDEILYHRFDDDTHHEWFGIVQSGDSVDSMVA